MQLVEIKVQIKYKSLRELYCHYILHMYKYTACIYIYIHYVRGRVSRWIIKAELKPSSNNMKDASHLHTQSNAVLTK